MANTSKKNREKKTANKNIDYFGRKYYPNKRGGEKN